MKIALGSDHAGFEAKQALARELAGQGHEIRDEGTGGPESVDYPDFAEAVARAVSSGEAERGILVCGTGIGMSMAANRVPGVRAALCHDEYTAHMSRAHNDANVLCLGARILAEAAMTRIAGVWLSTDFEGGKHARRVGKIMKTGGNQEA
jgi:ribose 5-phosphate isomerase B